MKRYLLLLALAVLTLGCATDPDPAEIERDVTVQPRDPDMEDPDPDEDPDAEITDPRDIPSFDVVTYSSGDFDPDETIRLNAFSRATVFASIIEALELAEDMSAEQREDLHDALFRGVPENGAGTFRAVAVSDYFSSGEPLYLLLGVDEPANDAPDDVVRTVLIQSSVLHNRDRIATRAYGRLVDMSVNISWIYHLDADGVVSETSTAFGPGLTDRSLDDVMPHEQVDRDAAQPGDVEDFELPDLIETGRTIDRPDVVPEEFAEEPPPVIDVGEPFTAETQAALARGAEPTDIPEAASERVRLANRLIESATTTDTLNVPMLVDSLIADSSTEDAVRVEAAFVRVLYAMLYEHADDVEEHAQTLSSVREDVSSIPTRLEYRVDTIVPILLETYDRNNR